ncbi:hypothetical protein JCM3774_002068 [Rhodotorula dairenensis]
MLASSLSAWNARRDAPTSSSVDSDSAQGPAQQQLQREQHRRAQQPPSPPPLPQQLARPTPLRTSSYPAAASRRGRPEGKPPRPMNAWLLFRTEQLKLLQSENPDGARKSQGELSKIIAETWRNCDPGVRQSFEDLAKKRKAEFRLMYPDYRYGPSKEKPKITRAPAPGRSEARSRPQLRIDPLRASTSRATLDQAPVYQTSSMATSERQPGIAAGSVLPTPISAKVPSSSRNPVMFQAEHPGPPAAAAVHHLDYMLPSAPTPSSAPAGTSSFQASLAFLSGSIDSLAEPAEVSESLCGSGTVSYKLTHTLPN